MRFEVINWGGETMFLASTFDAARSWVARNGQAGDAIVDNDTDEIVEF